MRVGKIFIFLFFILLIPLVVADDYTEYGTSDRDYFIDTEGLFNSGLASATLTASASLSDVTGIPLIGDLDGDGTEEMIHFNNKQIVLRSASTLAQLGSYVIPGSNVSNGVMFDITNDTTLEYTVMDITSRVIYIFDYDGENFTNTTEYDVSGYTSSEATDEYMLACLDAHHCMAFHGRTYEVTSSLDFVSFNETTIGSDWNDMINGHAATFNHYCFPNDKKIYHGDVDGDNDPETVINFIYMADADFWRYSTIIFTNNYTHETIERHFYNQDSRSTPTGDTACPVSKSGHQMTAPLVFDLNPGGSDEIIYGYAPDENYYEIVAYYGTTGALYDTYPFQPTNRPYGNMISNVIKGHFFPEKTYTGDGQDICIAVYDDAPDNVRIRFICATKDPGFLIPETRFFDVNVTGATLSDITDRGNTIMHRVNFASDTYNNAGGTINPDEILTPVGIFTPYLTDAVCQIGLKNCSINTEFAIPLYDGAVIPADVSGNSRTQLVIQTGSALALYTDGFTNTPAYISGITYSPCSPMKLNETATFDVTVDDLNGGDLVRSRVSFYDGTGNQQLSDWSPFLAQGTTWTHTFTANATGTVVNWKVYATDNVDNATNSTVSGFVTVATTGFEWSECFSDAYSDSDGDGTDDGDAGDGGAGSDTDTGNNTVVNILNPIADSTGLGVSVLYIICIFIALFMFGWQLKDVFESHPRMMMGFLTFMGILALIVGVKLNLISTGIIVTISVLSVIALGVIGWKSFQPHNM